MNKRIKGSTNIIEVITIIIEEAEIEGEGVIIPLVIIKDNRMIMEI